MSTMEQRAYNRDYMRAVRAGVHRPRRRLPKGIVANFRPLRDPIDGHCVFCGLESIDDVCIVCRREIEVARSRS